ncbi:MAG: hypothetical protein OEM84_11655 [Acidimicrobiia bacterium]|nr:hypothetical protein [Acidimicrobiia bacterium]
MRIRNLLMFVAALPLVATACAGDDTEAEITTTVAANGVTTTTAAVQESTTTTTTTTTTAAPDETTASSCGGSSGGLASLQESLSRTRDATKGRMEGSITVAGVSELPGASFAMPFSGAFDNGAGNSSFIIDMGFFASQLGEEIPPEMAGLFGEMEVRTIGDTSYIRFPFFSIFLGTETEWIATPVEEGQSATSEFGGPSNPADFLEFFEEANGTVEELGRETIRGIETTRYGVVFDMKDSLANATQEERAQIDAQGLPPIDCLPMDLWISDDGLVNKYVIEMDGTDLDVPEDEAFESMVIDFEMYDYGSDIVIEAPPADQVTDMESLNFGIPEL